MQATSVVLLLLFWYNRRMVERVRNADGSWDRDRTPKLDIVKANPTPYDVKRVSALVSPIQRQNDARETASAGMDSKTWVSLKI